MTDLMNTESEASNPPVNLINEDLKLQSSISPEYKSSWNDVNIKVNQLIHFICQHCHSLCTFS